MQNLGITDPHWLITFPNYIEPQEEEWLPGLLLRCDEANGWFSGTTAAYLARLATGPQTLSRPALFVIASFFELPLFAERLAVTSQEIFATTFISPLQRLYAPAVPNAAQLGPIPPFRICPECLTQGRLLHYSLVLPGIDHCPKHHLVLQSTCRCGAPLRPFSKLTKPYTCKRCGLLWSNLPWIPADPVSIALENRRLLLYQFLLTRGTPTVIAHALTLIRSTPLHPAEEAHKPPDETLPFMGTYYSGTPSLAFLVMHLAARGITADDILNRMRHTSKETRSCLNRACPLFGDVDAGNVHRYGHRAGVQEWYCSMCGSRFIGERLCLSFDQQDDASTGLCPPISSIERAQERLAGWKQRLRVACEELLARGEPIAVENVFALARIPGTANLRATRLGLVQIVADYADRQQALLPKQKRERWAIRTHMHRRKNIAEHIGSNPTR